MVNSKRFYSTTAKHGLDSNHHAKLYAQKKSPVESHRAFLFIKSAMIYFIIDFLNMLSSLLFVS